MVGADESTDLCRHPLVQILLCRHTVIKKYKFLFSFFFKKMGQPWPLFVFSNTHYKFYNKLVCEKISIQYLAPGFALTTF